MGTRSCFPKGLLLSACLLALWPPHGSRAALRIQKIPEQPQKNQDLLLSLQGVPDSFQDFTWYRGAEAHGGTMLFTYIPGLQRPQRPGSALGQRDIVGFPNGSMLLRRAQPSDSGTYQVAVAINPAWTMRAKTEVRVAEKPQKLPATSPPLDAGLLAATVIGCLSTGLLLAGSLAFLLVTRGCSGPRATTSGKPELGPRGDTGKLPPPSAVLPHQGLPGGLDSALRIPGPPPSCFSSFSVAVPPAIMRGILMGNPGSQRRDGLGCWGAVTSGSPPPSSASGDNNVYGVMPSPVLLATPLGNTGPTSAASPPTLPLPLRPELEAHQYQDLLHPDSSPYCQLVPKS
uniref:carcinoembryonic antigen-related cell adhesion molecule 19 n=1 Tax=Ictidomys tridecemlineatus TaxID=43179 RepID=UPI001A9F1371|nr:carcinoembryonic antigen-related cell adhesion molecule 19 [Ictidomys tridecemlineatus]